MKKIGLALIMSLIFVVFSVANVTTASAYLPGTAYDWGPGVPNYNPSAVIHPGTIDTNLLAIGDFVGISPAQPNAPGYGDSGAIVGWDDSWVSGVGHPNTNGDKLDGLWAQIIYPAEGWWDLGFATDRVVVFLSQDHGPYLAEGLETRVYGSNTLWGAVSAQAVLTDVYLDGWRPHDPAEDSNGNGWCSDDIAGVYQLPGMYRYVMIAAWSSVPRLNEPEVDAVAALCPRAQLFTVTQSGVTHVVNPIEDVQSAADFYDYYSASGHTPFMEDQVSKIYVYKDTTTGELSLTMHHSIDDSESLYMRVDFDLEGVPADAYTALSDDPSHGWNPDRIGGQEFDLTQEPEGNWEHYRNSDGGVIGGLPTDEPWCITVNPDFIAGIDAWQYQTPTGVENIELDMDQPVTICYTPGTLLDALHEIKNLREYVEELFDMGLISEYKYERIMGDLARTEEDIHNAIHYLNTVREGFDDELEGLYALYYAVKRLEYLIWDIEHWVKYGYVPIEPANEIIQELEAIKMKMIRKARCEARSEKVLAKAAIKDAEERGKYIASWLHNEIYYIEQHLAYAEYWLEKGLQYRAAYYFKVAFWRSQRTIRYVYDWSWDIDFPPWVDKLEGISTVPG